MADKRKNTDEPVKLKRRKQQNLVYEKSTLGGSSRGKGTGKKGSGNSGKTSKSSARRRRKERIRRRRRRLMLALIVVLVIILACFIGVVCSKKKASTKKSATTEATTASKTKATTTEATTESEETTTEATEAAAGEWKEVDGEQYYYGEDGKVVTGRFALDGCIYYTNKKGAVIRTIDGSKPMVALTFDNGPTSVSSSIVDVLTKNDVTGTFFEIGNQIQGHEKIEKKILKADCELASHTYSNHPGNKVKAIKKELSKTSKKLKKMGEDSTIYLRTPGGKVSSNMLEAADVPIILWTVDTRDSQNQDQEEIYDRATTDIQDGDIIRFTALYKPTVYALETIIPTLKKQGFQMVTIEDMAELRGGTKAGKVYKSFPPEGSGEVAVTTATTATTEKKETKDSKDSKDSDKKSTTSKKKATTSAKKSTESTKKYNDGEQ